MSVWCVTIQKIYHCKCLACCITVTVLLLVGYHWFDGCVGDLYTQALCSQYEKQAITGSLCVDLCRLHAFHMSSCTPHWHGFQIYHEASMDLKVDISVFAGLRDHLDLSSSFVQPVLGVSMKEFTELLTQFVDGWLGPGDHSTLIQDLLKFADDNRDNRVSLAEAKSLWALVQHREFFMAFVLRHSTLSSPFHGFCGDMFATHPLPNPSLYWLPSPKSWYYRVVAPIARSLWPLWPTRAKHAVALLEFASEIYAGENGSFFVCDASAAMFGVDSSDSVKLLSWNYIYSHHELQLLADSRSCHTDADCVLVAPDCLSYCDSQKHKCTLQRPAVAVVCKLLEPYLRPKAPRSVAADISRLLARCTALNASAVNFPLQHAVVTSELKSLLWRRISIHVS